MEQAQAEGQVDVLSFVRNMRDKRYLMVQTVVWAQTLIIVINKLIY